MGSQCGGRVPQATAQPRGNPQGVAPLYEGEDRAADATHSRYRCANTTALPDPCPMPHSPSQRDCAKIKANLRAKAK